MFRRSVLIGLVAFLAVLLLFSSFASYRGGSTGNGTVISVRAQTQPTPVPSVRVGTNGGRIVGGGPSSGK